MRVLVSARIRDGATTEPTLFAPLTGYFLDQEGNRYDTAVMTSDKTDEVLEPHVSMSIVPGETSRYYLVAVTHSSPYSNAPPSQRLTKLVVYLAGKAPQEVPIKKPQ